MRPYYISEAKVEAYLFLTLLLLPETETKVPGFLNLKQPCMYAYSYISVETHDSSDSYWLSNEMPLQCNCEEWTLIRPGINYLT
jgi:hypothetical protein